MATPKSPFYIVENFLSPKMCEQIVIDMDYYIPDTDPDGRPIQMEKHHEPSEQIIFDKFNSLIPTLEKYYDFEHRGTEMMRFQFYPQGAESTPLCDNSSWIRKQWARTKDRDFSVILFLSDYQDDVPFDNDFEVYGGKYEFAQHGFGFNPQRGTLIVYPSGPHFINAVADIVAGDLFMVKFHLAAQIPYFHNPNNFPGDYTTWFR